MNLTRELIEDMEAGPEMNRLIAENVMGFSAGVYVPRMFGGDGKVTPLSPDYSGNIAAALQIVEKIGLFKYDLVLKQETDHRNDDGSLTYKFLIGEYDIVQKWGEYYLEFKTRVQAPTAALVICKAALMTKI